MRNRILSALALGVALAWLSCGTAFAGSAGGGSGTTTTTTTTATVNTGTINAGTIYQGTVNVSGAMSAQVLYTWGTLRAGAQIIDGLQASLNATSQTALSYFRNAAGTLPSNLELLTASAPLSNPFLYYQSGNGSGFEFPTSITDGANALGVELKAVGGRTYRWSSTVSGPTNYQYAISSSVANTSTASTTVSTGDFVIASNVNTATDVTNYTGDANVSVYEVDGNKYVSPIVLDMKGTGRLQASGGNWLPHPGKLQRDRVIAFDFNANGFEVLMEWVGPDDGLLVEPKADGTVDGSCLFGTTGGYLNGYEKLSVRDANGDRKLNGHELDGLCVWQDRNGNGRVDDHELTSVRGLGITEINLNHSNFQSTFVINGASRAMWDWWPSALDVRKVRVADLKAH